MSDKKKSQATTVTELAIESGAVFFHTAEFKEYAAIRVNGHLETLALKGQAARRWLASLYRQTTGGQAPSAQALQDALTTLQGHAGYEGDEEEVHLRLAGQDGAIYIDLGDRDWRVVKVSTEGWEVLDLAPVYFRRMRGMLPLPLPKPGSVDALRPFLNMESVTDFRLLMTTLATYFFPSGPFVVLVVTGEQGSAKSFMTRLMKDLVDPSSAPLRSLPRDERDLMISATNAWLMNFDNVSSIKDWMSDALCRLSTGSGFATRELYTDSDEAIFAAARPIILNGISSFVTRGDLADRSLPITLPPVGDGKRRADDDILDEFRRVRPYIFGGILDLVVEALRSERTVQIARLPRMATFARRGYAMAPLLGWTGEDFLIAYRDRMRDTGGDVLDSSLIAGVLVTFIEDRDTWEGTATELLAEMNHMASETMRASKAWPKAANAMSNEVKRLAPTLRSVGINVEFDRDRRRRWISIRKMGENIVTTVTPSPDHAYQSSSCDDAVTMGDDAVTIPMFESAAEFVSELPTGDDGDDQLRDLSNGDPPSVVDGDESEPPRCAECGGPAENQDGYSGIWWCNVCTGGPVWTKPMPLMRMQG